MLDVFAADDPPQEVAVVNHRSTSTIAVTTAIGGRVPVGAALPVTVQWGTESETFGQDGVGLGNLQLMARSRLLTRGAYRLGARLDGALPVGATQMWTGGSPELSVASTHAVEWRGVTWMADTGLRLRTPLDTGANLVVGTEWLGGTGVRVAYGMIAVSTSVVGRLNTRSISGANGFEGLLSLAVQASDDLDLELIGGHGLTDGYGATDGRVLIGLRARRLKRAKPPVVVQAPVAPAPASVAIAATSPDPPEELTAAVVEMASDIQPEFSTVLVEEPILFRQGSAVLSDEALEQVHAIVQVLTSTARIDRVEVVGYASGEGSKSVNHALSLRRAKTVYRALIAEGVSPSLMSFSAHGEQGEAHASTWRRVELYLTMSSEVKNQDAAPAVERSSQ